MIFVLRLSTVPRLIDVRLLGRYTKHPSLGIARAECPPWVRACNDVISGWIDNNNTNNNNNTQQNSVSLCDVKYYIFIVNHNNNIIIPVWYEHDDQYNNDNNKNSWPIGYNDTLTTPRLTATPETCKTSICGVGVGKDLARSVVHPSRDHHHDTLSSRGVPIQYI